MALAKGHEDLGAKLATGLTILHRTGEYETIHHHWFGALEPKPLTAWQIARTGLWVFLPLVLGILAVLVWNGSLRRRVHRATAELQASEALLKAVIDSIPLMLFVKDPNRDFQFTVWNTKAEELIGIPRQELLGKTDYDILPAEQVEQLRAADIKVLESARQLDIPEETILSPVRGAVLLHTIKVPVRDEEGRVRFLLGISEDLTVFKRIEAQLCRSQASLSGAQRLARMGSWEWDFAKKEAYWSDGMFRILGLEPGACQPSLEAILNLSHPLDRERLNALLDPDAIEGSPETLDHRVILPDGTERVLLSHLEIQRDAAGKALRILGTAQDITERRTAEESLRQTQRLESLGVLAGGIAHDFNNLLTAILGNLNLAQKQAGSGHPALPYLQKIENTVMRASTLARQMLAYSGRGTFLIKPLDLNRLVQEMTHLLEVSISKKTVFRFALDPFIPWIDADEGQIQQVVMNLVTNAAEAIGDIEGLITLCTRMQILDEEALATQFTAQELRPGTYVVLEVKDTGCGMEPEVLRRLFEPFYTTKFSGRGLGLSALRGILKSHKGGIQIESEPGGGSTFRLYFPASSERPLAESEPQESPEANQSRGTILIAEDEPMIRLSTSEMLQSLGYRVLEAPDGLVAVELFRTHQDEVSAVLLDLTMPRMDGREALRAILALQPDAKVIICSGYHEQEALQGTEARTITGFLAKPYRLRELQGLLDRVL
jgi:PAS domain S-box-containing protein